MNRNPHFRTLLAGLLLVLILPVSCRKHAAVEEPLDRDVVARVGSELIMKADLDGELSLRGLADTPAARSQVLEEMIGFKRLILEARSMGWHQDEESRRALERSLAKRVRAAHEEQLEKLSPPAEAELRAIYQANLESYRQPAAALGAIMIRHGSPQETAAVLTKALEGAALPADGSFGALAIDASEDQATRYRGGRMRWLGGNQAATSQWPAEVFAALFALEKPGEVSQVVPFAKGAFVVRLIEKRAGEPTPFEKAAGELQSRHLTKIRAEMEKEFQQKLAAKYPARIPQPATP